MRSSDDDDEYRMRRRDRMMERGDDIEDELGEGLGEGMMLEREHFREGGEGRRGRRGYERGEERYLEEGLFGGVNILGWAIRIIVIVFILGFACSATLFLFLMSKH
jgi:hypothetical protein